MVKEDGTIVLDGQPVSPEALETELTARVAANPQLQVVVGADEQVAHGRVVTVMDVARRAGVEKLAFAVDRP
ncbi:Biopolymer transport protein ExbD/TolR [compost metagenome]